MTHSTFETKGGRHIRREAAVAWRPAILIVLAAVLLRGPTVGLSVIDWDETAYALVAREILNGHWPYARAFDHKPIGLYLHFAAAMALGGDTPVATRVLGLVVVALAALVLHATLVRHLALGPRTALAIALGYVLASSGMGGAATNTEHFINLYVLLALFVLVRAVGRGPGHFLLAGALMGVCFQVNYLSAPVLLGLAAGFSVFLWRVTPAEAGPGWRLGRALLLGLVGFLTANALLLAPVALLGDIREYFALQYAFLTGYQSVAGPEQIALGIGRRLQLFVPLFVMLGWLLFFALKGPAGHDARPRDPFSEHAFRAWLVLLSAILAGSVLATVASGRLYPHYFLLLLPPLCLLVGLALRPHLWCSRVRQLALSVFLGVTLAISSDGFVAAARGGLALAQMAAGAAPTRDPPRVVAAHAARALPPGETAYVLCGQPVLYQLLGVTAPTRFPFYLHHLSKPSADSLGFRPEDKLAEILDRRPFMVIKGDLQDGCDAIFTYLAERGLDFHETLRARGYTRLETVQGYELYVR